MKYDGSISSLSSNDNKYENIRDHRAKPFSTAWKAVVSIVALLDFLSTIMNRRFFLSDSSDDDNFKVTSHLRIFSQDISLPYQILQELCFWLDKNSSMIGFIFSVLCCMDAFRIAGRDADIALSEWDRRQLMRSMRSALDLEEKPGLSRRERYKTWIVYYSALLLQFLLLPVGFYLLLHKLFRFNPNSPNTTEEVKALLESTYHFDNLPEEYRSFSNETKLALGFAVAKHSGDAVYQAASLQMRKLLWKQGLKSGRKLGWKAMLHPIKYYKHTKKILSWARWIRYLIPLIGALFKMRHNLHELILTHNQRRQRKIAERVRRLRWIEMTGNERRSRAARKLQSTYRSYRERQACWGIMLSLKEKDDEAARRLQQALRVLLENARAKEHQKQTELKTLETKRRTSIVRKGYNLWTMDSKDRQRLDELRKQLKPDVARSIDRRLLMRPDSTFQAFWRTLFVCCVLLEIIAYLSNAHWAKQGRKVNGETLTVSMTLLNMLIPSSVMDLKTCSCIPTTDQAFRAWEELLVWTESCKSGPWYCHPLYYYPQAAYVATIRFVIERIMTLMALVTLSDVPIFFFTGIFQPDTGLLIPKPFIERWILPGLLLQLAVNPQMEATGKIVSKVLKSSFQIGPIRVWRWIRALFYPFLVALLDYAEGSIWIPLVAFANGTNQKTAPEEVQVPEGRRRSSINPRRVSIYMSDASITKISHRQSYAGSTPPRKSLIQRSK